MTDLVSLAPMLPEILVAGGALLLLMYGVFRPDSEALGEAVGWLAIALLAAAAVLVAWPLREGQLLFENAFISDGFARFMKVLVLSASALSLVLSFDFLRHARLMKFEFPVLVLLATAGMMIMVSANDLIPLYLGLELQSLALYVVAAMQRDNVRSSEAGLKYFVLGALSSGMLLYGVSLLYGFTGSTSLEVIASVTRVEGAGRDLGLLFGLVFLLVGLAFKVSAVPFHMWTPDVYEGAPTPVTAFFSAAPKLAAMALLVRAVLSGFPGIAVQWQQIIVFLSIASMLLGAFAAIGQSNIKRLMAYSSIGHIGFVLVGLAANSPEGIQGVLVYLAIYLVMTLGAFACILAMRRDGEMVEEIEELAGLAQTNLPLAFVFAMLLFSLAGVPPLAGFFAKFYVFASAIKAELYMLAVIGMLATVIAAYYYLRIVKIMFFDDPKPGFAGVGPNLGFAMVVSGLFVLLYVALPWPLVEAAAAAAKSLHF